MNNRIVTQDRAWRREDVKDITINFAKWLDKNSTTKSYEQLFDEYNKEKNLNI